MVTLFLRDEGCTVTAVEDGLEALAALDALAARGPGLPDVVLLDWRMPQLDGDGFVRAYRERPGPHAPIVVVTAVTETERRDLIERGFADVVPKPFDLDDLAVALRPFLACLRRGN